VAPNAWAGASARRPGTVGDQPPRTVDGDDRGETYAPGPVTQLVARRPLLAIASAINRVADQLENLAASRM
jgi:hypothetical protein